MLVLGKQNIIVLPILGDLHFEIVIEVLQFEPLPSFLVEVGLQRVEVDF